MPNSISEIDRSNCAFVRNFLTDLQKFRRAGLGSVIHSAREEVNSDSVTDCEYWGEGWMMGGSAQTVQHSTRKNWNLFPIFHKIGQYEYKFGWWWCRLTQWQMQGRGTADTGQRPGQGCVAHTVQTHSGEWSVRRQCRLSSNKVSSAAIAHIAEYYLLVVENAKLLLHRHCE